MLVTGKATQKLKCEKAKTPQFKMSPKVHKG